MSVTEGVPVNGQRMRAIRQSLGLTQQQLAVLAGVNRAYLSEFETGSRPSLPEAMMERLVSAALGPDDRFEMRIIRLGGRWRLVVEHDDQVEVPERALLRWTGPDGRKESLYLGDPHA